MAKKLLEIYPNEKEGILDKKYVNFQFSEADFQINIFFIVMMICIFVLIGIKFY